MTLSTNDRHESVNVALRLMLDRVGDEGCEHIFIEPETPTFAAVLPTTWLELLRRGLVRRAVRNHLLTGEGWLRAMELAGRLDAEFDRKIGELCAFLKQKVKVEGKREKGSGGRRPARPSGTPQRFHRISGHDLEGLRLV